jgi:predicted AAA+ superfamily ATPase
MSNAYQRPFGRVLKKRLGEPRGFLQVITGARQVGKTTLVDQITRELDKPIRFVSADEPTLRGRMWLTQQWEASRLEAEAGGGVLVVDEIQKVEGWSEVVKRLWDEDTRHQCPLQVVLLGSAPLLVERGLSERLAGRFETLHVPHWSYVEMRDAFGYSLEEFLVFGGYPGAAALKEDPSRWRRYMLDSLIETSVSRDILLLNRVDKPALLRRLFELGCRYSGQILSYTKMLGQLHDAGNTTTLAHYLELLAGAGMLTGLPKFAGQVVRQRASSPKLQVYNTGLMSALEGLGPSEMRRDPDFRGRLVESAVGAHLINAARRSGGDVMYWREKNREVDFVYRVGRRMIAFEVKSGRRQGGLSGLTAFEKAFSPDRCLLVGGDGIDLELFLKTPPEHWLRDAGMMMEQDVNGTENDPAWSQEEIDDDQGR